MEYVSIALAVLVYMAAGTVFVRLMVPVFPELRDDPVLSGYGVLVWPAFAATAALFLVAALLLYGVGYLFQWLCGE